MLIVIGILAVLSMIAIAKAIYWKLCFQGVLLYIVHSLKALTNDEISYRIAGGHVDIEYKDLSERGCLLVDSFFIAVGDIQQSYGTEYVQVTAADGR